MKREIKNTGKSIRNKLLALAKKKDLRYMYVLQRYFLERILYRVSISKYKDNFVLKGGSLLYAFQGLSCRPTIDVDLMGQKIDNDSEHLKDVFGQILSIESVEDAVAFDWQNISVAPIAVDKKYPGTRLMFTVHMDTIRQDLMMDIGFGDVVVPCPAEINYPVLLPKMPAITLKAYSIETVLAEKFNAMVDRDIQNSRMKDFYDCYTILTTMDVDHEILKDAVVSTFANRHTPYNPSLQLFTENFYTDKLRISKWNAFLKKILYKEALPFATVMAIIKVKFEPIWETLKNKNYD